MKRMKKAGKEGTGKWQEQEQCYLPPSPTHVGTHGAAGAGKRKRTPEAKMLAAMPEVEGRHLVR